ncbi:E3 ubiquitin/ISG15 ligase TRIM25-like [Paramormyrops kingsleyae]|uniref:E3 ubiquitin/ISG15 ligase TRIM25-like n=1 Tax=Paramormyrops kingsleyae TaxID=1676925 RepID=UPI000CD63EA7|nr:tripartite motif-containing protein 16-like [Paramormyrops kingsleyae]
MAEASVTLTENQFSCSICLDLLKDPVAIPCGHSYCMNCIKNFWDKEDHAGVYSCPQCRQTFTPRPVLGRNTMLAEVVKKLKTGLQPTTPADHDAGPGDVECDVCTGRKQKAVKSCLGCLASYCETHLQPHYESPAFKKHKLTDATGHLQEKVCSNHDKPLEVYCRTDQQCICYLCTMDEHRGHDTVSASARVAEIQKQMVETQKGFEQKIGLRKKELEELKMAVDSIPVTIFTEMISSIERRRSEVTELIRVQEKAAVSQAQEHMERLEEEIAELKRRQLELEQLSHTVDHIHFLQRFQCLLGPSDGAFGPRISINPQCSYENVKNVVSGLKEELENVCEKKTAEIHQTVASYVVLQEIVPSTRAEFLEYSCRLTLDPNTANRNLRLSEFNRVVTWEGCMQPYADHPERFNSNGQVLCTEGLTGCCYWEVEWSGQQFGIALAYKGIGRQEGSNDSMYGQNDKSWCFKYNPGGYYSYNYSFCHNNETIQLYGCLSSKIGVYLDARAGILSFYNASDNNMTLLHRVQTTFTEPLYPGIYLYGGTAKLC